MNKREVRKLSNGLYRVFWKSGGSSLAAIGTLHDGTKWLAPTNWTAKFALSIALSSYWSKVKSIYIIKPDEQHANEAGLLEGGMITDRELREKGYRTFDSNVQLYPYTNYFYQKRFDDKRGTKFFLNFLHYEASDQFEARMNLEFPLGLTMEIKVWGFKNFSLQDIEDKALSIFDSIGANYYDE